MKTRNQVSESNLPIPIDIDILKELKKAECPDPIIWYARDWEDLVLPTSGETR